MKKEAKQPIVQTLERLFETNDTYGAGYSTIMVPVVWVADDTNVDDTTEVAIDLGSEACAAVADVDPAVRLTSTHHNLLWRWAET